MWLLRLHSEREVTRLTVRSRPWSPAPALTRSDWTPADSPEPDALTLRPPRFGGTTHFTAEIVAALGVTGERAARMVGTPICPADNDAHWIAECRRLHAAGDVRGAAGAYVRIGNPARQKRLGHELWGFV